MICDAHVHVGRYYKYTPGAGERDRVDFYYTPQHIADVLKSAGISEFIFSSISCQRHVPFDVVEREAHETVDAFGPGAHPFLWVTGFYFDKDPDLKVLDSGFWHGVKIHELETPWVKRRPKDIERILSVLEERDVPVQFHTGEDEGCYPHEILPFVMRHQNLRVDYAHCRPHKETIECLKRCQNLFTDTAFMPTECYPDLVSAGVDGQVMFGTDLPIQGGFYEGSLEKLYADELTAAKTAGYSERVMSNNFHRFLGQDNTVKLTDS